MKKLLTFLVLNCLLLTVNNSSSAQNTNESKEILKIGVLLPLSGEYEILGQSFSELSRYLSSGDGSDADTSPPVQN